MNRAEATESAAANSSANFFCSWSRQVRSSAANCPLKRLDALLHVGAELLQALGESPQFFGIDNGLRHGQWLVVSGGG